MKKVLKNWFLLSCSNCRFNKNFILLFFLFFFVFNIKSQENSFKEVTAYKEFTNYKIEEITQDSYNNIWLATNKGLLKFNGVSITNFDFKIGESSQKTNTVLPVNDFLYIGKNKNFYLKTYNNLFTFKAKNVNKIYKHKNEIFIGSNEGLYQFKEDYLQPLQTVVKLDFSIINDIIFYHNFFYIASNNGLWKLDKLYKPSKIIHLKKGDFSSFLNLENTLLTVENSHSIIEITTDEKLKTRYTENEISKIYKLKNEIYITTKNNGITVLDNTDFTFKKRLNKYNSNLKENTIFSVFKDAEENIFIATENNLYIKKSNIIKEKTALAIADLAVNYRSVDSINVNTYNNVLQLKSNQNNVSFLLQNISISNPENIEYRYKLNGEFSPWSNSKRVDFANLNYGNYNFIVESRFKNSDEISRKKFSFYIDTPLYKKVWFLILSVAVLCLLLAFFVDVHIRKINKKNQQKINELKFENHLLTLEQKALQLQMNPHFIFNVLNGIKALGNTGKTKELNTTISQFSILLRSVLTNSRLEEISLDNEIETLKNYLDLEQKMSAKSFDYAIETNLKNIAVEEILIPPMLVQPFIENAIKHGISANKKGKITLFFEVKQHHLECTITDNGIGFYQSQKTKKDANHTSVALKITKERIENLSRKGTFKAEEIKEENTVLGTKVWFKIPLKTDY